MINDGMKFDDALKLAQELGYAESNPAADVEGHDACRKICIISSLVYGRHVYPDSVYTKGITDIKLEDVQIVDKIGAIKLIAQVSRISDETILPTVMPMIVPHESLLSSVSDVFNAVMVNGDGIDKVMFYGRGAGKLPTASAVMGDIVEAEKHSKTVLSQSWESASDNSFVEDYTKLSARMYFRVNAADKDKVNSVSGNAEVICSDDNNYAFVTEKLSIKQALEMQDKLKDNGVEVITLLPLLSE